MEQAAAVFCQQEKDRIGRPLLQQLEHGILGALVHPVRLLQQIDLPLPLVGTDVGVRTQGPHLVHCNGFSLPGTGDDRHIRVDAGGHLPAGGTVAAGTLPAGVSTQHSPAQQPGQGMPPQPRRAGEDIGVGQAPAPLLLGEDRLHMGVARQGRQFHNIPRFSPKGRFKVSLTLRGYYILFPANRPVLFP